MIDQDPVELLGHRTVKRAHSGLDVRHRDPRLCRRQGPGQRRVGVTVDEHEIGRRAFQNRLERGQHPRRLRGARAERDAELFVGRGQAELCEEDRRQAVVEVLPGVDEQLLVDGAQPR